MTSILAEAERKNISVMTCGSPSVSMQANGPAVGEWEVAVHSDSEVDMIVSPLHIMAMSLKKRCHFITANHISD